MKIMTVTAYVSRVEMLVHHGMDHFTFKQVKQRVGTTILRTQGKEGAHWEGKVAWF